MAVSVGAAGAAVAVLAAAGAQLTSKIAIRVNDKMVFMNILRTFITQHRNIQFQFLKINGL
jgi:hypothetical protein